MRSVLTELEVRYFYPPITYPQSGQWEWQRHRERLWIPVPDQSDGTTRVVLPPLFFSYNSANTWHLVLTWGNDGNNGPRFSLRTPDGFALAWHDWRETALWSQVKFDPFSPAPGEPVNLTQTMRGPWWLRWRCPNAQHDILSEVMEYIDGVLDDPYDPLTIANSMEDLRRKILMHQMGEPT